MMAARAGRGGDPSARRPGGPHTNTYTAAGLNCIFPPHLQAASSPGGRPSQATAAAPCV
jgi:hypothetical protein